jgi:superfamily II DNA or RNA helicase
VSRLVEGNADGTLKGANTVTTETAAETAKNWSHYQTAIFDDVAQGRGNTVVLARAGTGKTTTILEALKHVPEGATALMVAFNKAIATEMKDRAPGNVDVSTLHSYGALAERLVVPMKPAVRVGATLRVKLSE